MVPNLQKELNKWFCVCNVHRLAGDIIIKNCQYQQFLAHFLPFLSPLQASKLNQSIFLVVEVPIFNLVGHMWKSVENWLQKLDFYLFENEGVNLDNLHILKIGFKNGLGNVPTRFTWGLPKVCLKFAWGWPKVGPRFAQTLAQGLAEVCPKFCPRFAQSLPRFAWGWPKVGPWFAQTLAQGLPEVLHEVLP